MNTDRDKLVKEIFADALEMANAAERAAYLAQACGHDAQLRQQVDALLQAHEKAGGFLEDPAAALPGKTIVLSTPLTEKPGDRIGRYKLREKIGEGGCGVVYVAEQEEPVRRRVALKVIKLGMDTKAVIARFEAERQALAMMDHPNIAKVLDVGTTETGRPYFVMELVRGIKITDYCDQNKLSTPERLGLFMQVCHAVQHAHQKGIIHRDIKPSNILVTLHDGVPVPKVIDFGIAKATEGRLTDLTVYTELHQFIGTPAYMSPEQAEMSGLDIDTRSDIYSLGVLLYELLTGKTPFDPQELLQSGLDAMRRTIREQEPPRPSTRLSTMLDADLTAVAQRHGAESPRLIHLIRGDLDWITMKALEKDRTRRYETANGLALDLERHLKNEAIIARPQSSAYRFQKLVQRNKLAFAAAGAVTAALVIGLALSTWFFFKEREARQQAVAAGKKAQAEASKSQQVAQFLQDMLNGFGPSVSMGRDTTMLREMLDKTGERVGKDLKDSPEVEAELRTTLGEVYQALGQFTKAEEMHRAALALRRALWGNTNTNVADSLEKLANSLEWQTKPAEAEPLVLEALTIRTNLLGAEHPKVAESLEVLGYVREDQGRYTEAGELYRRSLAMRRKLLGNDSLEVADSLVDVGGLLLDNGRRLQEAEAATREALAIQKKLLGEECPDPKLGASQEQLGFVLLLEGKLDEAETTLRPILAMRRKLLGSESILVANPGSLLAAVLQQEGKLDEAEQLDREALATYARLKEASTPGGARASAYCMADLCRILYKKGKLAEAEAMFREAVEIASKVSDLGQAWVLVNLGNLLCDQGKPAEAVTLYREAVEIARKVPTSDDKAYALGFLGNELRDQGKLAEAEPLYREGLNIWHQVATNNFGQHQWMLAGLGSVLSKQGKPAEAESLYREAVEAARKLPSSTDLADSLAHLGDFLRDAGKPAEAEPLFREGLNICRQLSSSDFERHSWLAGGLAVTLKQQGRWAEAEPFYREAVTNSAKLWPNDFKKWEWQFNDLVDVLQRQSKTNEVESLRREAKASGWNWQSSSPLMSELANQGDLLRDQGKFAEAEPVYREGLEICRQLATNNPETHQWLAAGLGLALKNQDKWAEAESFYREAITNSAKVWPNDFKKWEWQVNDLVEVLQRQSKTNEVEQLRHEILPAVVPGRPLETTNTNQTSTTNLTP